MTKNFSLIGNLLTAFSSKYNYQVSPTSPSGKPGKIQKSAREYRMQLIQKTLSSRADYASALLNFLQDTLLASEIKWNPISVNSSKYPSYSFSIAGKEFDVVIARGANKGETFESTFISDFASGKLNEVTELLRHSNNDFSKDISIVYQRTGSTKKEGISIENLGSVIGDVVIEDSAGKKWFLSLKDVNGNTFSSYSGAASLFDSSGELQIDSTGADFLNAFGVDLNLVQSGFDKRNMISVARNLLNVSVCDPVEMKKIFERAWGMNYFYVRKLSSDWKVFWLDRELLDKMTSDIVVREIRYPSDKSKQITILCGNAYYEYIIEIRNSKAGEYPNDIKFKVR